MIGAVRQGSGSIARKLGPLLVPALMAAMLLVLLFHDPRPRTHVRQLPGDDRTLQLLLELGAPYNASTDIPIAEGMIKLRDMVKADAFGPRGERSWVTVTIDLYPRTAERPVTLARLRFPYARFAASPYWTLAKILNLADRVEISPEGRVLATGLCRSKSGRQFGRDFCALALAG